MFITDEKIVFNMFPLKDRNVTVFVSEYVWYLKINTRLIPYTKS